MVSHVYPAPTHAQPPPLTTSISEWYLFQLMNLHWCIVIKVHRFHYSHTCTFCGSGQMYRDMYPSLWYYIEYFHCLKHYLCFAPLSPHFPHPPLARIDLFTVSIVLSFPECHLIEIVKIMTLSDWLLSLSNMHLSFFHGILCLDSSFIFSSE